VGRKADHISLYSPDFKNERNCNSIPPFKCMACTGKTSLPLSFKFAAGRRYFVQLAVCGQLHCSAHLVLGNKIVA